MGKKGERSKKGEGELYSSPKKKRSVSLTDESWRVLGAVSDRLRGEGMPVSRSELIERLVRIHLAKEVSTLESSELVELHYSGD